MVARILRLRLALLGGPFRGSFGRGLRTTLGLLLLIAGAAALAALPTLLIDDPVVRDVVDVVSGSLLLIAVFLVPFFENRGNLEPRQFQLLPARAGTIGFALLATSIVSWPFFAFAAWLVSFAVFRDDGGASAGITAAALVLAALLALCSVRVVSLLSKLLAGERFAGALRTAGVLLLLVILPVAVFAVVGAFRPEGARWATDAAEVLGWTPFGAPFSALVLAGDGAASGDVLARLGIAAAAIVVLLLIWFPLVSFANRSVERPIDPGVARRGLGWFERFAARPASVIAARELTYWARDPRYRVALFAIPLAPVLMLAAFWVAGADLRPLAIVPLPVILLLLGWSQHNDVAMDSTAIWSHVASGIRGAADRAGRLAPVMMLGIPLALIGSSITVTLLGDWRVLPAVVGMNLGVLFVSSGVSSVFSVLMPYPTTRPGDSPFLQPQWAGSGSGLAQTLSMLFALALSVPPVWASVTALLDVEFMPNVWALLFGAGYGLAILGLGILIGGWIFKRSGPELIAVTQVFD